MTDIKITQSVTDMCVVIDIPDKFWCKVFPEEMERLFRWLVNNVNKTDKYSATTLKSAGVIFYRGEPPGAIYVTTIKNPPEPQFLSTSVVYTLIAKLAEKLAILYERGIQ